MMSGKPIDWRDYGDVLIAYYEDSENGIYLKFRSDAPYEELRWRDKPFPLTYPHGCPTGGTRQLGCDRPTSHPPAPLGEAQGRLNAAPGVGNGGTEAELTDPEERFNLVRIVHRQSI
jgi:hypothetical protein